MRSRIVLAIFLYYVCSFIASTLHLSDELVSPGHLRLSRFGFSLSRFAFSLGWPGNRHFGKVEEKIHPAQKIPVIHLAGIVPCYAIILTFLISPTSNSAWVVDFPSGYMRLDFPLTGFH